MKATTLYIRRKFRKTSGKQTPVFQVKIVKRQTAETGRIGDISATERKQFHMPRGVLPPPEFLADMTGLRIQFPAFMAG